jgi:hypothetical protein
MKIYSALILLFPALLSCPSFAAEWFAAPDGKATNAGSKEAPWDAVSTLNGTQKVAPGDVLWLRGGVYAREGNKPIEIKVRGTKEQPIQVRGALGERATFTTGIDVLPPATYFWLRDVEIAGVVPKEQRISKQSGSWPNDMPNVPGGLTVHTGEGCKFINLVIHDNLGGVGWWKGSTDSEFYGCLIYDNGWKGPDRNHGHAIYAQNETGWKTISNCIMTVPWGDGQYTMHAYGSDKAWVDNFLIENNVAYGQQTKFLIGGGRPSKNIRALNNYLYEQGLQLGYGEGPNHNGEVRGNVILGGGLHLKNWQNTVSENNLIVPGAPIPTTPRIVWLPDKYDDKRAHLVIYNWHKAPQITVPATPFLKAGETARLLHPENFYGKPLWQGKVENNSFTLPMDDEFAVFVVLKM